MRNRVHNLNFANCISVLAAKQSSALGCPESPGVELDLTLWTCKSSNCCSTVLACNLLLTACLHTPASLLRGCRFDLSYKGKTVGEATLTGVIVYAEKGVVAVNAEIIIKVSLVRQLALAMLTQQLGPHSACLWQCNLCSAPV